MASPVISIEITRKASAPPATGIQLYRKPHDVEIRNYNLNDKVYGWEFMGVGYRSGPVRDAVLNDPLSNPTKSPMPEVYRIYPDHQTPISCPFVTLWRHMNPGLSVKQFSTLMNPTLAWMNRTGSPPRYNCLTGENQGERDPSFDAARLGGGALAKGTEGYSLMEALREAATLIQGVIRRTIMYQPFRQSVLALASRNILNLETIRTNEPAPAVADVLARPWLWYWGTAVTRTGQVNLIQRTGMDGQLHPVRVPVITRLAVYVPLKWLHKLPAGYVPPDARWMPV